LSYDEVASGELGRQAKGESAEVSGSPRRTTDESQRNQANARVSGVSNLGRISLLNDKTHDNLLPMRLEESASSVDVQLVQPRRQAFILEFECSRESVQDIGSVDQVGRERKVGWLHMRVSFEMPVSAQDGVLARKNSDDKKNEVGKVD
jgi:hypothetical protein